MARRPEDVGVLKLLFSELERLEKEVPPGYRYVQDTIAQARRAAKDALGSLLVELELEKR